MGDRSAFILKFDPKLYLEEEIKPILDTFRFVNTDLKDVGLIIGWDKGSVEYFMEEIAFPSWVEVNIIREWNNGFSFRHDSTPHDEGEVR